MFDYLRQKHYEERKMFEGDAKDTSLDLGQVVDDDEEEDGKGPDEEEADKGPDERAGG